VTHIALPGNLLAAWALGRMLQFSAAPLHNETQPNASNLRSQMVLVSLAVLLLLVFLGVALWRLFSAGEGLEGQASLLQGLIPLLVAGVLIYGVLTIGQSLGTRLTLALAALTVLGAVAVYEIHATWMVVYDHPDTPREMLIFVQSSPDVPLISQEIHELAISQTRNRRTDADPIGGYSMPVIMDIGDDAGEYSLAWPYYWYMRDMQRLENRKADFFQNASADSFQVAVDTTQPDGEKEFAPVVMVAVPHMTESTRAALEANYVKKWSSNLNWWFPYGSKCDPQAPGYSRFYYNSWTSAAVLTQPAPKGCGPNAPAPDQFAPPWGVFTWPFERANWADTWRFLLYREIPEPLRISGREMEVWVRRDLAGGGAAQPTASSSGQLKLLAEQAFGTPGKETGQLDQPHGLAVDTQGNVYVADSGAHRVTVFGPDGKLLREIGSFGSGPGQFNEPHGIAVDTQGNLYVADTWNARIDKFDANGTFVKSWGQGQPDQSGRLLTITDGTEAGNAAAPLGFYGPRGVAVDKQGNVYIADTGNKRIVVTDGEGNFLYQWGSAGAGPGQFSEPIGLTLDGRGNLYVADSWNSRVQVFGRDQDNRVSAAPIVTWNVSGWQPNTYYDPFVAANESGQVFLAVPGRDTVLYANTRGDVLLSWGGKGNDLASFTLPSGVAVGPNGSVYVVDYGGGRVLKFSLPNVADPAAGS
jgi:sugar lactone lactonase YvrE